ncbi:MAG: 4Fe-4S binding protein [Deltaproteobacteria bacterium]|nr:MAG: 4Fe-4S binding protein [Deltaproteobacteria bacterium]
MSGGATQLRARAARLRELLREALQAAFRLVPWPTEPGLRAVGAPGPFSPVIVTGNYDLTVRRVMRALRGVDAWLVVAPSNGINVWCAASGGMFTTHQVVTALKTCGIEDRVKHRRAILPQLAATGVQAREVARRCGWRLRFGPVYAQDLPRYLAGDQKKTDAMRRVRFGVAERLEMAAAWAAPAALVVAAGAALVKPAFAPGLVALAVILATTCFLVYDRIPEPRRLLFGVAAVAAALAGVALAGGETPALLTAAAGGAALTALLTFDYSGSTPTEGGSHFEERSWHIVLDRERCRGVYSCWEVCPEACFEKRPNLHTVDLAHDGRCIRCGACVVQCPMDALAFEDAEGRRVEPDAIRRFKLNLLGRRAVDAGSPGAGAVAEPPEAP